ncbi:hypothetical protein MMC21_008187 [Puttea exsequens]|nr:hypothetical protein [Puttea exsequens]
MSGVVEVSLPRFSITPLDRQEDAELYWGLNPKASTLKGGSWTIFNWNGLVTGSKLYRLQYSDELQIPQADADFEELISFLLDRGAVPDVKGLHMLRLAGIWTPVGTSLLICPDTTESVLRVALPNDSDGVLSLALRWKSGWDMKAEGVLPPGWMRLQLPEPLRTGGEKEKKKSIEDSVQLEALPRLLADGKATFKFRPMSIRLRLGHLGNSVTISNAVWEHEYMPLAGGPSLDHLMSVAAASWAPSIALALGLSQSLPLYNHRLDPWLISLAIRDTIPCGVLVTLGLLDESETPEWETKYNRDESAYRSHARFVASSREMMAEAKMPPEQARLAREKRQMAESQAFHDQCADDRARDRERRIKRRREAIGSPRLESAVVSNSALDYMKEQKLVNRDAGIKDVAEALLVSLLKQEEQAMKAVSILERWRAWGDRAGMLLEDLDSLEDDKLAFCRAACVLDLFKETSTKKESAVALDMRECVQQWRKVRLG